MKIVNPILSSNTITYISRFDVTSGATSATTITLYDAVTKLTTDVTTACTYTVLDGYTSIDIPSSGYTFIEGRLIKMEIENDAMDLVLYRADILPTTQPTETYKLTTNKYEYK